MATEAPNRQHKRNRAARQPIGLRVPPDELVEIDRRAAQRGMDRTAYMIAASLGLLDGADLELQERIAEHERRLARLEELAFGQ